jgi:glycosyltransferase involved in cell wall biosynthesis
VSTRVIRIIARLNVGGPTRHVVWLTSALSPPEYESLLVSGTVPPGEEDMSWFARQHGVVPTVIPGLSREISFRDAMVVWKLFRLFLAYRPDIIHTHTAKAGAVGRVAAFLYNAIPFRRGPAARVIHTYHGHIFHSYYGRFRTRIFLTIERILARLATDRILVLSERQREEICEQFRVGQASQFRVVPLGLDYEAVLASPARGGELRNRLGIESGTRVVGIVGRLTEVKNHDLFLRAARRVSMALNEVHFVIFGDGLQKPVIERRIAELDLGGLVSLAGTEQPDSIYALLDVVALTSLNEGTPLALIEAMANRIPVISTAVGGVPDVLGAVVEEAGVEGYTLRERGIAVPTEDEAAFSRGLLRLLNDQALAARLADSAHDYVLAHYSKNRLIADIVTTYNATPPADSCGNS